MPYKARLKSGEERKRAKPRYRVTNHHEYNKSLKSRGKISLYFPSGDVKAQLVDESPYTTGVSGRSASYRVAYVELLYTFYRLFGWGMRQITGYMEDYWQTRGLEIPVPSFGHLSDLFAGLDVGIKQRCQRLAKRLASGEALSIVVDSTGLRFGRASHWHQEKYGKKAGRTPWRKLHLSIDADMNMHGVAITTTEVSDSEGFDRVVPTDTKIGQITADGAYYSIERVEHLAAQGIVPAMRPPSHSVIHNAPGTTVHDQMVGYIKEKGIYAFQNKFGYGIRSRVESQISRIKRCIGSNLLTQKLKSQENEGVIIANIVNFWNSLGRPVCVKIG